VHAAGELATARAAQARSTLMICSMMSNASISEITAVTGDYWMQLYPSPDKAFLAHLLQAAEGSGCQAVVLTVDGPARGNHEAERWFRSMRKPGSKRRIAPLGNFSSYQGPRRIGDPSLTWEGLGWFKKNSKLPLLLKGVMTREDARLCLDAGVDGLVVSNHGGRQEGSSRGTLDVLPEIVAEVQGRIPVLLDGGIRRGSDALKALAIGADAVCIGRPYLWGLGAFGEEGVARALSILQTELVREMTYAGVPSLAAINKGYVWIDE